MVPRGGGFAATLMAAAALGLGPLAHFSVMLGSAAKLSQTASDTVDAGIHAFSNATHDTTAFFLAAASSTLTCTQELWRGVDIYNVSVSIERRRAVADEFGDLQDWVQDGEVAGIRMLNAAEKQALLHAATQVGLRSPRVEGDSARLLWPGSYRVFEYAAGLLPSGHIFVQWRTTSATFEHRWANPFWQLMELDTGTESEQVLAALNATLQALPDRLVRWSDTADEFYVHAMPPSSPRARLRRWARAWQLNMRSLAQLFLDFVAFWF